MQTASSAHHSIRTGEGDIPSPILPSDLVSFLFHQNDEILTAAAFLHGIGDIVHQPEFPAFSLQRCPIFSGRHLLPAALVFGQDGETVGHADIVTDHPQKLQGVGVLMQLQTSLEVHGVDDEVTVDMVGIAVGGDENLRTGPGTGGEFHGDLMRLLGSDILRGFEGLHILVEVDAAHFSMCSLGRFKLQNGIHPIAVDTADEPLAGTLVPGLVLSHAVPHDIPHGTEMLLLLRDKSYGSYAASPPRLMR